MKQLVTHETMQDIVVLKLHFNEINLEEREKLQKKLNSFIDAGNIKFIIDFSDVSFISSLAITIVVAFAKTARKAGGDVKLCGMAEDLIKVFHVMNLDRIFERYSSVYFAIKSFSGQT